MCRRPTRDGLPTVSEASRLTSRAAGVPEASRDGLPTVRRDALPTLPYLATTVTHLKKYVSNQLTKRDLLE
jgi:hypothetical protein